MPPMSSYETSGFSVICMAWMVESASGGSTSTTACEWRCMAMDALGLSFSRSIVESTRTK